MPEVSIRTYAESDHAALLSMAQDVVRDGTVFPFEDVEGVLGYWFGPQNHIYVAVVGETVAGTYVIKPNHPGRGSHVCNAGYLVAEKLRAQGIGEALGRHSLESARALGFRAMQFNQVVSTNVAAIRLWQRLGFRIVAELPQTFRHASLGLVDTFVMFRELAENSGQPPGPSGDRSGGR